MKIDFLSKSDDNRENQVIYEFVEFIATDLGKLDIINIERILETDARTPDFLVKDLLSIVEIKKVTEDPSTMQKIGSLRNNILSKIEREVKSNLGNLTDNILVSINNSTALKSRGKEYKSLIQNISKDICDKNDYGFSGDYGYRIYRKEGIPNLMVIYAGHEYPTPEKLAEHLKDKMAIAIDQLSKYQETYRLKDYKKILIFDHFFTHTEDPSLTVNAIEIAYNLLSTTGLDYIFLRMNKAIIKVR
ncbi:hypothetical protein [Leptospira licerasiae]|uniref:DUF4263 domain-containing protein n=1 Tax=Leptospira licerasiae str. MMD4847 TaxID=1049971 RepID=A0ABN0HE05_9LEPT|nr:hypothetical protein [Leptospira licerasiae]EIE01273.1 hypothetical protein LEP1GSC185_3870 [Leptospira licerasiae serovar Varillal str. VAR 010]EJZ43879.1 hypothetical protein LEP1GSC178_2021 [Leptospira licerasiae str. MMD4847]